MRVCLLASGSKGNAIFVESDGVRLLIDAGLSAREIARRLALIDVCPDSLSAILVSHEHTDHGRGVGPMARRHGLAVFMQRETFEAMPRLGALSQLNHFRCGETLEIGAIRVETFSLTHDVAQCGFVICSEEGRVGIATDLGIATRLVSQRLRQCRVLIIESNHDELMLRDGPYPWVLKQRVKSQHGHLSNEASAALLEQLLWPGLEAVFLAHLSETNNCPALAESIARRVLDAETPCEPRLVVGTQDEPSACFIT